MGQNWAPCSGPFPAALAQEQGCEEGSSEHIQSPLSPQRGWLSGQGGGTQPAGGCSPHLRPLRIPSWSPNLGCLLQSPPPPPSCQISIVAMVTEQKRQTHGCSPRPCSCPPQRGPGQEPPPQPARALASETGEHPPSAQKGRHRPSYQVAVKPPPQATVVWAVPRCAGGGGTCGLLNQKGGPPVPENGGPASPMAPPQAGEGF